MRGDDPRIEPPALDAYSDLPLYNTKAVVHQTGVPAPTLRAWERRYGILAPERGSNEYRLYSARDIVTVIWLRERVQAGMTISQAIALLKSLRVDTQPPVEAAHEPANGHGNGNGNGNGHSATVHAPGPARYALEDLRATLLHELANFDEFAARRTIAQALTVHPVEEVCTGLLSPVLKQIGQLWADGDLNVVTEHFASNVVRSQLESLFRGMGEFDTGPLVLVGCAPGELHEIGTLMLALYLRRAGIHVAYLGQMVETESLLETIQARRPAAVVLAAVMPTSVPPLRDAARLVADVHEPRPFFGFGGQAFTHAPEAIHTIPGTFLDEDLAEATRTIRARLRH